jgi:Na+/proline symporter
MYMYVFLKMFCMRTTERSLQGGIKTVVWTDLFQALVMITGLVAIIVRGSSLAGGMKRFPTSPQQVPNQFQKSSQKVP